MRYGRTVDPGFLPVHSVDTVEQARDLLTLACERSATGEYIARELADHQTIERLFEFGARLRRLEQKHLNGRA